MSLMKYIEPQGRFCIYRAFTALAGHEGGRLLSQIAYWCLLPSKKTGESKLRIPYKGKLWAAKTRKEWCAETELTEWQYKKGMKRLLELDVIDRASGKLFGRERATYFRIKTEELMKALIEAKVQHDLEEELAEAISKASAPDQSGVAIHIDMDNLSTSYLIQKTLAVDSLATEVALETHTGILPEISGETKTESQPLEIYENLKIYKKLEICENYEKLENYENLKNENFSHKVVKKENPGVPPAKQYLVPEKEMKAQDVLNKKQLDAVAPPPLATPGSLALLWVKRMADVTGGYVKSLTLKEKGQLKHYLVAVGTESARSGIEYAFANWVAFTWKARAAKGLSSVPEQPVVGFLLAHHDVLLQLIATANQAAPPSHHPSPPHSSGSQKPLNSSTIPVIPGPCASNTGAKPDYPTKEHQAKALEQLAAIVKAKG